MATLIPDQVLLYRNALEPLITDEVMRQLEQLSPKLVKYINQSN